MQCCGPSSGTFRVPSPTSSDEEDVTKEEARLLESQLRAHIQLQDRATLPETLARPIDSTPASPLSDHPSQLGDYSPLYSIVDQSSSPAPFLKKTNEWSSSESTSNKMVAEREPPRPAGQNAAPVPAALLPGVSGSGDLQKPVLPKDKVQSNSSVFNVPKPHKARPEHHRPAAPPAGPSYENGLIFSRPKYPYDPTGRERSQNDGSKPAFPPGTWGCLTGPPEQRFYTSPVGGNASQRLYNPNPYTNPGFRHPLQQRSTPNESPEVVEIPKPANFPTWNQQPRPQPVYSAYQSKAPGHTSRSLADQYVIDLTKSDGFDPNAALRDDRFGAVDPYTYVDSGQATENIKALLEGTFDDEEDKPRTRRQRQNSSKLAEDLADKLKDLAVESENLEGKVKAETAAQEEDEDDEEDIDDGSVEGLKVKLLPHQIEGVDWMRDKEIGKKKKNGILPKGGILADDMGLGKTIQSIALILTNPRPPLSSSTIDKKALSPHVGKNTLVVAPLALIRQWEAELDDKVSDGHKLRVCVHHGPQRTKRYEDLKRYDIVITTYQILVSEHGGSSEREGGPQVGCFGIHWYRVILDEAHTIKNRNAKATQACYALRAEYRWCLTGTPMQNNLDELQSLIKFLRIKPYNDLQIWREQITNPLNHGRGGIAMRRLQVYLRAFMKRRTKDILKKDGALNAGGKKNKDGTSEGFKIVERKVESIATEFTPSEQEFYNRLEQRAGQSLDELMEHEGINYASALVLLLRLRQACNHPQLLKGALAKDNDALTTGQSEKKSQVADKDVDDMADLLGGLSVETKKCDICQKKLSGEETAAKQTACNECKEDLSGQKQRHKKHRSRRSTNPKVKSEPKSRRAYKRRILVDDSDEEEDGDWLVPEDQRHYSSLGKAGGTGDENAEGEGESLGVSDSDTNDEEESSLRQERADSVIEISDSEASDSASDSDADISHPVISTKIRELLVLLKRESSTYKFIVYSQFTSMLDLIEPFLRRNGLTYTRYDGSMRNDAREQSLAQLRSSSSSSPRILLCSLKCGSLGLNLTAASRVVILEPFWNPFVEEQAIDRVHRLNQTVDVVVYKLTVANTVEARILDLQERKRELARRAIEGGAAQGKKNEAAKLSMRDILRLFGRDAEYGDGDRDRHPGDGGVVSRPAGVLRPTAVVDREAGGSSEGRSREGQQGKSAGASGQDSIWGRRW